MPSLTPIPPAAPQGILKSQLVLRTGPDRKYEPVGSYPQGTKFDILGINENGSWYYILLLDGTHAWVSANPLRVDTSGDISNLPIAPAPTQTP